MNTFQNNYDELEKIIYEGGLRIKAAYFHPDLDLLVIVPNNKKVLLRPLSVSGKLKEATLDQLLNYRLIARGVGIHWPQLDEDLSLKGILQDEPAEFLEDMRQVQIVPSSPAAADAL